MALRFDPIEEARRNWDELDWLGGAEMATATAITRAHQIVLARMNEVLAPHGLTLSRFEALAVLQFTRAGALPLGRMGERLQVHPASVTNTIDRLERDGLVERTPHPDDRRTVLAAITPAGRDLVVKAASSLAAIGFGVPELTSRQRSALDEGLRSLRHSAGDFELDQHPSDSDAGPESN